MFYVINESKSSRVIVIVHISYKQNWHTNFIWSSYFHATASFPVSGSVKFMLIAVSPWFIHWWPIHKSLNAYKCYHNSFSNACNVVIIDNLPVNLTLITVNFDVQFPAPYAMFTEVSISTTTHVWLPYQRAPVE